MRSAGAPRRVGCGYRDWLLMEISIRRTQYPFAIDSRYIHYDRISAPGALWRNYRTRYGTKFSTIHFASLLRITWLSGQHALSG